MSATFPAPSPPRILAIAGGSCSGKTTLANAVKDYIGEEHCSVICQDNYYFDIGDRGGSAEVNFDIPDALDFALLRDNLMALKRCEAVALPQYDFTSHQRATPSEPQRASALIIVEGILLLTQDRLRKLFDQSVFICCDSDLRLSRRLARDTTERGRTRADVLRQFHEQVEPAHQSYVAPSEQHANLILDQHDYLNNTPRVIQTLAAMMN